MCSSFFEDHALFPVLKMSAVRNSVAFTVLGTPKTLNYSHFRWMQQLPQRNVSVFFIVDSKDNNHLSNAYNNTNMFILSISDKISCAHGYCYMDMFTMQRFKRSANAWDKFMYFFSKVVSSFDFHWVIEADVFIPSLAAFDRVHNSYFEYGPNGPRYDLVSSPLKYDLHRWPHREWAKLKGYQDPIAHNLMCAAGISKVLMQKIALYAAKYKQLPYVEVVFSNLALFHNLAIINPPELKTINWKGPPPSCVNIKKNLWFHPVKDIEKLLRRCASK